MRSLQDLKGADNKLWSLDAGLQVQLHKTCHPHLVHCQPDQTKQKLMRGNSKQAAC